jgi:hypothetical protein
MEIKEMLKNSIKISDIPNDACPFSWREVRLSRGCLGNFISFIPIIGSFFKDVSVYTPVPCVGDKCKLWNNKRSDCVFNDISLG